MPGKMAEYIWSLFPPMASCILLLSFASTSLMGQDLSLSGFVEEYEPATAELSAFYDNVGMKFSYSRDYKSALPEKYQSRKDSSSCVYKATDGFFLVKTTFEKGNFEGEVHLLLVNGEGFFTFDKSTTSGAFLLTSHSHDYAEGRESILANSIVPHAPFAYNTRELLKWLTGKRVTVKRIIRQGQQVIINYESLGTLGGLVQSQLVLDGQNHFALLAHTRTAPDSQWKQTIRYDGSSNGIPLVKRVEIIRRDKSGVAEEMWEVQAYLPGPFDKTQFSLSTIDENEFEGVPKVWIYLLGGFCACFLLAFVVRMLKRRKSRSSQPG
jgi:hypothetical protein